MMTHRLRSERTFEPLYADDIAAAMELRTAGETAFGVYLDTGVTEADLYLAEQIGIEAYPMRPQPVAPTTQE